MNKNILEKLSEIKEIAKKNKIAAIDAANRLEIVKHEVDKLLEDPLLVSNIALNVILKSENSLLNSNNASVLTDINNFLLKKDRFDFPDFIPDNYKNLISELIDIKSNIHTLYARTGIISSSRVSMHYNCFMLNDKYIQEFLIPAIKEFGFCLSLERLIIRKDEEYYAPFNFSYKLNLI